MYIELGRIGEVSQYCPLFTYLSLTRSSLEWFPELERFYANRLAKLDRITPVTGEKAKDPVTNNSQSTKEKAATDGKDSSVDERLLEMGSVKELGEILETPAITIEVERAVLQVGQKLKAAREESSETKNQ